MIKILKKDLDLESVLFSGQCFRVSKKDDGFIVIMHDRVIFIKEEIKYLFVESSNENNLEKIIINFFDLNRDYESINNDLAKKDLIIKDIICKCKGFKILNQNSFEMFISYIISQNNNIKRISNIIEKLSKNYGKKVIFKNNTYYLFPEKKELYKLSEEKLNDLGLGYRSKYIISALNTLQNEKYYLEEIKKISTKDALIKLMKINGIGLKVASCILLFGFGRLDVYPIDTWVKQTISKFYNIKSDYNSIKNFTKNIFGDYCGLAIQYLYHTGRNLK